MIHRLTYRAAYRYDRPGEAPDDSVVRRGFTDQRTIAGGFTNGSGWNVRALDDPSCAAKSKDDAAMIGWKKYFVQRAFLATVIAGPYAAAQEADSSEPTHGADAPIPAERIRWHLPDPELDRARALERLEAAQERGDKIAVRHDRRVLDLVDSIRRPNQMHLSLEEVLRRTLANSYLIEISRTNPAVETTRVVEAESAFDAIFFTNLQKNNIDRPSGSQLLSTDLDLFSLNSGVSKRLAVGAVVQGRFDFRRTKTNLAFQQLNPEYTTNLVLEVRQPLLRGFGIDFNRSLIVLRQNDRKTSYWAFRRQVRDILRQVEELYWRIVQARRDVVISARLLADFAQILEYLEARKNFDIIPVQINATRASLEQTRVDFIIRVASVFDAEDRLIAAMNAHDIDLADDIEIIPTDSPQRARILVDRLAEVQTALENRPEIKEQQLAVANAGIAVGRARNAELPRLDVTLRQTIDGLGSNADRAWRENTQADFISYFIGMEFEMPIGNRGPRAAHKRSQLQYNQSVSLLKQRFEEVILDVNLAVRRLSTAYDAIGPSFESAQAREREVESLVARAERKDFLVLNNELSARRSLATARRNMLSAMVEYDVAMIDLERAKGTLLPYNNVVIPKMDDRTR